MYEWMSVKRVQIVTTVWSLNEQIILSICPPQSPYLHNHAILPPSARTAEARFVGYLPRCSSSVSARLSRYQRLTGAGRGLDHGVNFRSSVDFINFDINTYIDWNNIWRMRLMWCLSSLTGCFKIKDIYCLQTKCPLIKTTSLNTH